MVAGADLQITLTDGSLLPASSGGIPGAVGLEAPSLAILVSRGERRAPSGGSAEQRLCALFGVTDQPDAAAPAAALTRIHDAGEPAAGWWLRADPVEAQADQQTVRLLGNRHLRLGLEEAQSLAAELNVLLGQDGLRLQPLNPLRWYLRLPADPGIRGLSVEASLGRDLCACLPRGSRAASWRRLLTELEMLLSVSPVNHARLARGEPAVTSLWLWGGGALPPAPERRWISVAGDDPLSGGLARLSGGVLHPRPASAADWLAAAPGAGSHLIVLAADAALPESAVDGDLWRARVQGLERDWIQPLLGLMRKGQLGSLSLDTLAGPCWRLTPRGLRRWWRRPARLGGLW